MSSNSRKLAPTERQRKGHSPGPNRQNAVSAKKNSNPDYRSEGVKDNDIFLLPGSDFQIMAIVTVVAAVVRLFRIYEPSSVVFDEVQ